MVLAALTVLAPRAEAQTSADSTAAARELYGKGVDLFDRQDFSHAAVAFEQAYELVNKPVILYNLGLSYERLERNVEALDALEKALAGRAELKPRFVENAEKLVAILEKKVATLDIQCNVEGAEVFVDQNLIGVAPLASKVRVNQGRVLLSARAKNHLPTYQTLVAASGAQAITLTLDEAPRPLAQVKVHTTLPGAELYIDGQLVALTPLRATIPIEANQPHRIELRREGYLPAGESLTLGEGALSELTLQPTVDKNALASGGRLQLELAQADATLYVDGSRQDFGADAVGLPSGVHELRAERTGYEPLSRRVVVQRGEVTTLSLDLPPNPETRASFIADAELAQRLGWGFTVSGVVVAGVGTALFIWNRPRRVDAVAERDLRNGNLPPYDGCDTTESEFCAASERDTRAQFNETLGIEVASIVGMGVGAVGIGTGLYFLISGEDPDRYRIVIDDDVFGMQLTPTLQVAQGGVMLGVSGELTDF